MTRVVAHLEDTFWCFFVDFLHCQLDFHFEISLLKLLQTVSLKEVWTALGILSRVVSHHRLWNWLQVIRTRWPRLHEFTRRDRAWDFTCHWLHPQRLVHRLLHVCAIILEQSNLVVSLLDTLQLFLLERAFDLLEEILRFGGKVVWPLSFSRFHKRHRCFHELLQVFSVFRFHASHVAHIDRIPFVWWKDTMVLATAFSIVAFLDLISIKFLVLYLFHVCLESIWAFV